jgi:hypothetical protein
MVDGVHRAGNSRQIERGAVQPVGFRDAGPGDAVEDARNSWRQPEWPPRFHDASTALFGTCLSAAAMADIPLPKRPQGDAPGRTRTCDPLLRRPCRRGRRTMLEDDGTRLWTRFAAGLPRSRRIALRNPAGVFGPGLGHAAGPGIAHRSSTLKLSSGPTLARYQQQWSVGPIEVSDVPLAAKGTSARGGAADRALISCLRRLTHRCDTSAASLLTSGQ